MCPNGDNERRSETGRSQDVSEVGSVSLLLLGADDRDGLLGIVDGLIAQPESAHLEAGTALTGAGTRGARLALAAPAGELRMRLQEARGRLASLKSRRVAIKNRGIYIHLEDPLDRRSQRRIAFLFPGQGSQHPGMLRELRRMLPGVRAWFDALDRAFVRAGRMPPSRLIDDADPGAMFGLEQGLPLSTVANLAVFGVLSQLGLEADVYVGHSIGEHAAVLAAGQGSSGDRHAICEALCRLGLTGIALEEPAVAEAMATVSMLSRPGLDAIVARYAQRLYVAMDNCPSQLVVAGEHAAVEAATAAMVAAGGISARLPFARAYHTPLLEDCAAMAYRWYRELNLTPAPCSGRGTPVYSCLTSRAIPGEPVAAAGVMARQWTATVNFRGTIEHLASEGIDTFVEVGPDAKLTAFVEDVLRGRPHLAVSAGVAPARHVQRASMGELAQIGHMLAALYAHGVDVEPARYAALLRATPAVLAAAPEACGPVSMRAAALAVHRGLIDEAMKVLSATAATIEPYLQAVGKRQISDGLEDSDAGDLAGRWPLLGDQVSVAGGRLRAERAFALPRDAFLADHSMGRVRGEVTSRAAAKGMPLPVLAFTTSLEIAIEAASRLDVLESQGTGSRGPLVITDIRARRWLALDGGVLALRAEAVKQGPALYSALYESKQGASSSAEVPAFQALVQHGRAAQVAAWVPATLARPDPAGRRPAHWTVRSFYDEYAFHGPSFQGLVQVMQVGPAGAEALVRVQELPGVDSRMLELNPALLDCAGQLVAFWLLEQGGRAPTFGIFPVGAARVIRHRPIAQPQAQLTCRARITLDPGGITTADIGFFTADNQIVVSIEHFTQRLIEFAPALAGHLFGRSTAPFSEAVICAPGESGRQIAGAAWSVLSDGQGLWGRIVAALVLAPEEYRAWLALPAESGGQVSLSDWQTTWLLRALVIKEAAVSWAATYRQQAMELIEMRIESRADSMDAGCGSLRIECDRAGIPPLRVSLQEDGQTMRCVVAPESGAG